MKTAVIQKSKQVVNYLFFGNIFIALCAVCLVASTGILMQKPIPVNLYFFVFTATTFLYNFDSLSPQKLLQPAYLSDRKSWVKTHRSLILIWVMLTGALTIYLFFKLDFTISFFFIGHLFLISVLYSVPVFPTAAGWRPLRHIPLLKIFLIAYVWSCVTVWLPLLSVNQNITSAPGLLLFAQRFLYILALTILFDIRDLTRDQETRTLTVPGFWGITKAKLFSFTLLLGFGVLVFYLPVSATGKLALFISAFISGVVIGLAHQKRSEYFYAFIADGLMVLQFLLLLVLQEGPSQIFNNIRGN